MKIRYYKVRKGRGYWEPTDTMKAAGFASVGCGPDGAAAWSVAEEWNRRWDAARTGSEPRATGPVYAKGTIGHAWDAFRRSRTWAEKKPRTREDWERGWRHIKASFDEAAPRTVTFDVMDLWYAELLETTTVREAFGAMKTWRALWRVMAAMGMVDRDADPSLAVRRKTPQGRSATWSDGEVARLAKGAWRMGYRGLAALIAVAYDAQLAPVDARLLTPAQRASDGHGSYFSIERAKTGQAAIATLGRRSLKMLDAYIAQLGFDLAPGAPIFRHRSNGAYSKDTLGDDFRDVRAVVFPGDTRKLLDLRRSGAVEAMAGGATDSDLSAKMANSLSDSKALQRAYLPVDIASVRNADDARKEGRKKIRANAGGTKSVNSPARKV